MVDFETIRRELAWCLPVSGYAWQSIHKLLGDHRRSAWGHPLCPRLNWDFRVFRDNILYERFPQNQTWLAYDHLA